MWIVLALLGAAAMAIVAVLVLVSLVALGAVVALIAAAFALAWLAVSVLGPLLLLAALAVVVGRVVRRREVLLPQPVIAAVSVPAPMTEAESRRFRARHEREMMRLFDETLETRTRAPRRVD